MFGKHGASTPQSALDDFKWLLEWWRDNRSRFPRIVKIARRYIGILAVEVGVERLFSRGRDLLRLRRFSLKPVIIKMLTLLKAFYNYDYFLTLENDDVEEGEDIIVNWSLKSK